MKNIKKTNILNSRLITAYIISFVLAFMLYIYEPIIMYINNVNDFWFNLNIIIGPIIGMFLFIFIFISLIFTIIYFINKKISKKTLFYDICLIIFFIGFLCTYIQGNYLVNNLPPLDGTTIDWFGKEYMSQNIISIVVWVVVIAITVILTIKFKRDKIIKYTGFITLAIFVMLLVSLSSVLLTSSNTNKDVSRIVTSNNIDDASTNKNFFILVLDAVDSVTFEEEINNDEKYKDTFKDFTYFKDTMAVYPFTRDSVPMILTGIVNENEDDFRTYSTKALNDSELIKILKEKNYNTNIYETELIWDDDKSLEINNITLQDSALDIFIYLKEQTKYVLFKYLPFPLKKYSHIDTLDFKRSNYSLFQSYNIENYNRLKENKVNKISDNYFQFIHLDGAHVPFDIDKDLNPIENGTYQQKVQASLNIANTYLNRLRDNDVYDNSVIIVMADHGFADGDIIGRQNPILFIKGIDEHHDMIKSEIPVSFFDLNDAYQELLNDAKSTDLFSNISEPRERRFLYYAYTKEDHMEEMIQKGKAWDEDTLVSTGKEFNR